VLITISVVVVVVVVVPVKCPLLSCPRLKYEPRPSQQGSSKDNWLAEWTATPLCHWLIFAAGNNLTCVIVVVVVAIIVVAIVVVVAIVAVGVGYILETFGARHVLVLAVTYI